MEFTAILEKFDSRLWTYHIKVPYEVATHFLNADNKRVLASFNGNPPVHCAIMAAGNDVYFLNMNAETRKKYHLQIGSSIRVSLSKDTSKYGMPMPEELNAVLAEDGLFRELFEALTSGKQRNLIYIVNKVKDSDKRIEKSLIISEHLKFNRGKIDFKILNASLKGKII